MINIYQQGGITAFILGFICIYYFAGIFLGIFPGQKGVSWEGHLFGLIAGLVTSYLIFGYKREDQGAINTEGYSFLPLGN